MTAAELKAARHAFGLSANEFARLVGVSDGTTVRKWELEEGSTKRSIPGPVAVLVAALLESAAVRKHFGVTLL